MPTGARLFAAIVMALLAFVVSGQVMPLMPEGTDFGYFTPINCVIGAVVGWIVIGGRAGQGISSAITYGLTGMLSMMLWALLFYGALQMFDRAMSNRYGGPFEAVGGIFTEAIAYAGTIASLNIAVTLCIGGILAGLAAEFAAKRYR